MKRSQLMLLGMNAEVHDYVQFGPLFLYYLHDHS